MKLTAVLAFVAGILLAGPTLAFWPSDRFCGVFMSSDAGWSDIFRPNGCGMLRRPTEYEILWNCNCTIYGDVGCPSTGGPLTELKIHDRGNWSDFHFGPGFATFSYYCKFEPDPSK